MLSKVRLIAAREYLERVRGLGFKLTTLVGVMLILGLAFAPAIIKRIESPTQKRMAIVDRDSQITPALRDALPEKLPNGERELLITEVDSEQAGQQRLNDGAYDGLLVPDGLGTNDVSFEYKGTQPSDQVDRIRTALEVVTAQQRLANSDLGLEQISQAFKPVSFEVKPVDGAASVEQRQQSTFLVYALLFLLYLTILIYGSMVSASIVQEKSSRITEIMISSVRPIEQMIGKIAGIGLVGVTQYAFWVAAGAIALAIDHLRSGESSTELDAVPPSMLTVFVIFFLLGFLLYATLYAALGSVVSRTEDSTQLNIPILLLAIGGFLLSMIALAQPDNPVVVGASFVPFFSPMVMFTRIGLGSPPGWEVALAMVVLVVSILLAAWVSARIYRVGVLRYSKRPGFAEIARLAREAGK